MKKLWFVKLIFLFIGTGLLVGAYFLYQSTASFIEGAEEAPGTVINLSRSGSDEPTYYPEVEFKTREGQEVVFFSSTGSNPASYSVGEKVVVLYEPENPTNAEIKSFFSLWAGALIVGGIGVVFFLVGGIMVLVTVASARKKEYLLESGSTVETTFHNVSLNTRVSVNGRHPFRIYSQWQNPDTGKVHVFESEDIWFDPSEYIPEQPIVVYLERHKPSRYYMDISFLPELAE
jgi:hypothetical protein